MISKIRAAGFAAASLVAVFGTFYAGPSRAWDMNTPVVTSTYLDHAAALLDGGEAAAVNSDAPEGVIAAPPAALDHAAVPALPEVEPEPAPPARPANRSLAELVADYSTAETQDSEHECLAGAVYFESKGESLKGQLSVAEVVLNRARSGRFPATICGVVKQRHQFSFIRGGRFPPIPRATAAWRKAVAIATIAREELAEGPVPNALFFHATYVSPNWRGLKRVATVGNHVFYR